MVAMFPSRESEARVASDVELWGWAVFWVFGVICAIASYLLYWWNVNLDVLHSRFWIAGLLCAPSLRACLRRVYPRSEPRAVHPIAEGLADT